MLDLSLEVKEVKNRIELSTNVKELLALKEALNKIIDEQVNKIESNQESIVLIRYDSFNGKFVIEKGSQAEYIIYEGFMKTSEKLEEIECKRQGTKKYQTILENLKNKYNPEVIKA